MRLLPFLLTFITTPFIMACDRNKDPNEREVVIEQVSLTVEEDEITPPPPDLTSRFSSVEEWLSHLCNNEKPDSSITAYQFGLFQYDSSYAVSLVGIKEYSNGPHTVRRILFEPAEMYYPLPDSAYKGLSWQEANDKLTVQLKEFIDTDTFQESFFGLAQSITTGYNGKKIWSR